MVFHFLKLKISLTRDVLCQDWLREFGQMVLEKKIFRLVTTIQPFRYYLPSGKGRALHLNKLEFSPKDALCHVWLKLARWFWRRKFLKFKMAKF